MELVQWHDSFSVGVASIDSQHKKLFALLNELIVQSKTDPSQSRDSIKKILSELIEYTKYHFATEEKLLKIHAGFELHTAVHLEFVNTATKFVTAFKADKSDLKPAVMKFLVGWIKKHVIGMDKVYFQKLGYGKLEENGSLNNRNDSLIYKTILIAEDSPDQRLLLKTILEQAGYIVLEAENGKEALKIIQNNTNLRFIITDINMPEMDGYELIQELRKFQVRHIYIIVVTSLEDKKSVIKALRCGADDFLSKPVLPEELNLRIEGGQQLIKLESQDELIFSLAKLSDYRSQETGLHLERVQQYTLEIGEYLANHHPEKEITKHLANEISRVSPLHDIGKVGISDQILTKPGKLTDEEFEIIKEHSRIGGDLISDIYLKTGSPSLHIAFELTMFHHEKWDGTGYPAGLSGDGIPIAARIMALADVYDALTTDRVYKKAFSHEKAKKIIIKGKGKHFDPDLVDVFLALEQRFIQLKESLSDS